MFWFVKLWWHGILFLEKEIMPTGNFPTFWHLQKYSFEPSLASFCTFRLMRLLEVSIVNFRDVCVILLGQHSVLFLHMTIPRFSFGKPIPPLFSNHVIYMKLTLCVCPRDMLMTQLWPVGMPHSPGQLWSKGGSHPPFFSWNSWEKVWECFWSCWWPQCGKTRMRIKANERNRVEGEKFLKRGLKVQPCPSWTVRWDSKILPLLPLPPF